MITQESILKCKYVFFHSGCPDGIASREILLSAFPDMIPQPFHFGMKIEGDLEEKLKDGAIFIDIHPNLDQIDKLMEKYFICIADHHKTSLAKLSDLLETGYNNRISLGDNETGTSGAVLAYEIVKLANRLPECPCNIQDFATLIGISDTWQKDDVRFKVARNLANWIQIFGNKFQGIPDETMWQMIASYKEVSELKAKAMARGAVIRKTESFAVAFLNGDFISDASEVLRTQGINVIVGFKVITLPGKGECLNYSIRSDSTYNSRILCERFGGGGHDQAAGCSIPYTGQHPIDFLMGEL